MFYANCFLALFFVHTQKTSIKMQKKERGINDYVGVFFIRERKKRKTETKICVLPVVVLCKTIIVFMFNIDPFQLYVVG